MSKITDDIKEIKNIVKRLLKKMPDVTITKGSKATYKKNIENIDNKLDAVLTAVRELIWEDQLKQSKLEEPLIQEILNIKKNEERIIELEDRINRMCKTHVEPDFYGTRY